MKKSKIITLSLVLAATLILPAYVLAEMAGSASNDVVVSTRTLVRNHVITSRDVELISSRRRDPRAVRDVDSVIGKVLKRTIGASTTIKHDYLKDGSLKLESVDRGGDVRIIVEGEGLRVATEGKLRESAKVGEFVKIENLSSGKIITGRLIDDSTVVVNFQ
jgi:flagella basal body P-ring formation protein FlgA